MKLAIYILAAATLQGGQTEALFQAVREGDNAMLRTMLMHGHDPNVRDREGTPLLMNAVLYSDADAVRSLLEWGADPNARNAAQATALIWAAGDYKKASLLVKHGADVNAQSAPGRTALLAAASQDGAGPVVRLLLDHGAKIDVRDSVKSMPNVPSGSGGAPPVIEAAKARDGKALRLLIERGADVNVHDANGGSALTEAIMFGNIENVRSLLLAGAEVEYAATTARYTPLMLAAFRNNFEAARLLIDAGADLNARDSVGSTVLMWAAYSTETGNPRLADLLLESGAELNAKNRKGESALTWAAWHGATPMVAFLKQAGAVD